MSTKNENTKSKGGDESTQKPQSKKATKIVIIIMSVALVALIGVLLYLLLRNDEPEQETQVRDSIGGRAILATEENYDTILEEISKPVRDTQYLVSMSLDLKFDTWDQSTRSTVVRNDARNVRTVYFELFLDDADGEIGEMIYSSPYIPLGAELRDFGLDKELAAGTYQATMIYHMVDDDFEKITDLVLGVKVIINE
ncbi:MAG: hypothetical protein FWE14_07400 [Lachnospiraceae bacterium]|nr:hypothetical protein [Lachnospiraceae bacterium]